MRDGETSSANDKGNGRASAKDQDNRAAPPEVTTLDYDHVLLDLLAGCGKTLVEEANAP